MKEQRMGERMVCAECAERGEVPIAPLLERWMECVKCSEHGWQRGLRVEVVES